MRAFLRPVLLFSLLALCVGCSAQSADASFDLQEWGIAGPDVLTADAGSLDVVNSGALPHTLVVTDSTGEVVAATDLIAPGTGTTLDLDLEAGETYSFTCRIVAQNPEGEIVDHYEAGMNAMVSVAG